MGGLLLSHCLNSRQGLGSLKEKGFTFNGKVVFGIGIIMIAAAVYVRS